MNNGNRYIREGNDVCDKIARIAISEGPGTLEWLDEMIRRANAYDELLEVAKYSATMASTLKKCQYAKHTLDRIKNLDAKVDGCT